MDATHPSFAPYTPADRTPRRHGAELGLDADTVSELLEALEQGLPAESFERLKELLGVSQKALADYVGVSEATLHRRLKDGRFKPRESERLYRYLEIYERANALFEDDAKARAWLAKPALALGGDTPLGFARSERGAREVLDGIERLEHGVLG